MSAVVKVIGVAVVGCLGFAMGTSTNDRTITKTHTLRVIETPQACLDALRSAEGIFAVHSRVLQTWIDETNGKSADEVLVEVTAERNDMKPLTSAFIRQKGECRG